MTTKKVCHNKCVLLVAEMIGKYSQNKFKVLNVRCGPQRVDQLINPIDPYLHRKVLIVSFHQASLDVTHDFLDTRCHNVVRPWWELFFKLSARNWMNKLPLFTQLLT